VPAFLIAFTANMIVGQRLVRKICPNCVRSFKLPGHTLQQLKEQIDIDTIWATLQREEIIPKNQKIEETTFWRGSGCTQCGQEGYKGRIGIYEVMEVTPDIAKMINSQANTFDIQKVAVKEGMITMVEDGFIKAVKSITTIEEILRVTKD
jgi:type IV pilus assembly protein PilB